MAVQRGKEGRVGAEGIGEKEGKQKRGKEWLRESKRSEKHETRISLSITYALNPGIYASGINARVLDSPLDSPATSSRLKHVHAVRLYICERF